MDFHSCNWYASPSRLGSRSGGRVGHPCPSRWSAFLAARPPPLIFPLASCSLDFRLRPLCCHLRSSIFYNCLFNRRGRFAAPQSFFRAAGGHPWPPWVSQSSAFPFRSLYRGFALSVFRLVSRAAGLGAKPLFYLAFPAASGRP